MEALNGCGRFSKIFNMRRWPDRPGLEIRAVTESFGCIFFWYTETDTGNKNCHLLTELEYIEIGGKKYTVIDGVDRISMALEKEKVERLLERM